MSVKIRLSRKGRKQAPFYHILVADSRSPRDGKFIEKIGTYNPMTKPATIELDRDAAYDWLTKGAQPTDTVRAILRFKGVYYKKHLMRGLKKGALTQEQVDTLLKQWIDAKETPPPKGPKMLMIDKRLGVAVLGAWRDSDGWTHWCPLPTFKS